MLLGCNALLGIHDLSPDAASTDASSSCSDGCACAIDTDCAAHMYCDVEATSSACLCVAGYSETSGACTWTGVVTDPGFMTATTWMVGSATTIDATYSATGLIDPGVASTPVPAATRIDPIIVIPASATGEVSETFVMPRLSRAEPLVAAVHEAIVGDPAATNTGVDVGVGWAEETPALSSTWSTMRVCLGAAQYAPESSSGSGAASGLDLITTVTTESLDPSTLDYDHVEIVQAGSDECPAPGTVINGDASGSDGWAFHVSAATANDGASAGYTPTGGANGSPGVELSLVQICDDVTASVPVSVALPTGSGTALSLYHHKTGGTLTINFGNEPLTLGGETTGTIDHYCVPAPMQGVVTSLSADFEVDSGTCGSAGSEKAYLDSVDVDAASECALGSGVVDGGFEAEGTSGYQLMNVYRSASGDSAGTVDDGSAPEGVRYLKLAIVNTCDTAEWSAFVVTPPGQAGVGPALTFAYKSSGTGLTVNNTSLAASAWTTASICLDATVKPGRGQTVTFNLYDGTESCDATTLNAGIDALAVTTDPSCAPKP